MNGTIELDECEAMPLFVGPLSVPRHTTADSLEYPLSTEPTPPRLIHEWDPDKISPFGSLLLSLPPSIGAILTSPTEPYGEKLVDFVRDGRSKRTSQYRLPAKLDRLDPLYRQKNASILKGLGESLQIHVPDPKVLKEKNWMGWWNRFSCVVTEDESGCAVTRFVHLGFMAVVFLDSTTD